MLAESEGEILDNVDLISSLEDSKNTEAMIAVKLEESSKLEKEINQVRS